MIASVAIVARARQESPPRGTIVLVVGAFPSDSTFLLKKCARLLRTNPRIRVVCLDPPAANADSAGWPSADAVLVAQHTRFGWTTKSWLAAAVRLPVVLMSCMWRNPGGTIRYLIGGTRQFGPGVLRRLYLDAPFIESRPAIIHFEFGTLAVDRTHLAKLLGSRIVVSFRGYDLNYAALDQAEYYTKVWAHADVIHLLGEDLWTRALTRGCPADKPHIMIPPGVDAAFFDPSERVHSEMLGKTERPLRVLGVGRLVWKKGYEYALGAIRALVDAGIRVEYRIAGEGDFTEAILFARRQFQLEEFVQLLGVQSPEAVREQMLWADVLLHAAVSEGFCNAVVEAQAMRLPVVCTDADGLAENIADGETGFVVPRRNAAALAEKLQRLATDPALRQRMGEAGRRRAVSQFSVSRQMAAFEGLYQRLLQQS